MVYPNLKLKEWPFRTVPDENYCTFLADREQLKQDIVTLLNYLSIQPVSSLHLMWAWFGAGKTHTLKYLEYLCKTKYTSILPIYMEFPRSVTKFIDIYKLFIHGPIIDLIDDIFSKIYGEDFQKELQLDFPDLSKSLTIHVAGDDEEQDVAIRWLKSECKELRTLKKIGISRPIMSAEDAIKTISWIFKLIFEGSKYIINAKKRILWMIDEFQRIEDCRNSTQKEINNCLLSIFNRCPNCLSIIISFSGYPEEKKLPPWLSPELKDRIGINPFFLLPPLSEAEAYEFVKEVLCHFRDHESSVLNPFYPFCEESVKRIIRYIKEKAKQSNRKDQPKPRTIMQFFDIVLKTAYPKIKKQDIDLIKIDLIDKVLEGLVLPPD